MTPLLELLISTAFTALIDEFGPVDNGRLYAAAKRIAHAIVELMQVDESPDTIAAGHARADDPQLLVKVMLQKLQADLALQRAMSGIGELGAMLPPDAPTPRDVPK